MNSHLEPEIDCSLDPALLADLRRIGEEFETRRAPIRPAVESSGPRMRSRAVGRRGVVIALLAGCTATGALVATRQPTPDPVVSVIPKNLKVSDIAWIQLGTPDDEALREVSLVAVDGVDAVVTTVRGRSIPSNRSTDGEEFVVGGVSVFVQNQSLPGNSDRTSAEWQLPNGTFVSAVVRRDVKSSRPAVEQLVLDSRSPSASESSPQTAVAEVARWDERGSFVMYQLGGPLMQTDSSGVTRVSRARSSEFIATSRSDIPPELLPRVDAVRQPWTGKRFRSGDFLVEGNVSQNGLRTIRRSELRRLIKQVDRARAAEIARPYWKRLTKDLEYSDTYGVLCVRSRTDVACGQVLLSRLVGGTWVYSTIGQSADNVLVNGRVMSGVRSSSTGGLIYILPVDVQSVQTSFLQQDGTKFVVTSQRPDI